MVSISPSDYMSEGLIDINPCGPCKQIGPILEEISNEMSEVVIAKHNIDSEPNTPTKYGVRGRWRPNLLDWGDQF